MEEVEDQRVVPQMGEFVYQFVSKGSTYRLTVPLKLPYQGDSSEHAVRLVKAHKIPFHLEDEVREKLDSYAKSATLKMLDQAAEEKIYGGSVFEKGSDTDLSISKWSKKYTDNYMKFSMTGDSSVSSSDVGFSEIYHKLIHSPALETLLQLEHTYAMAVDEVVKAWDNARDIMHKRQDADLEKAMKALDSTTSEQDINTLMRQHTLERESCEFRWSNELNQLRESQKKEYRDWVTKVHEDMVSQNMTTIRQSMLIPPKPRSTEPSSSPSSSDDLLQSIRDKTPLEESFTINLGAQKKTMHNVRIISEDPLSFCRHKRGGEMGDIGPNPERLQTAMSLYSNSLSALIIMVDRRVNSLGGLKEAFAGVCHQSSDFHFPDIDAQLSKIQEYTLIKNMEQEKDSFSTSGTSSTLSDAGQEKTSLKSDDSASSGQPHPPAMPFTSVGKGGMAAGTGVWSGGSGSNGLEKQKKTSPLSVTLDPGDFYLTRHSNLSQVHAVFHLVSDDSTIMNSSLKTRDPILVGLKNCLRTATAHDIYHITLPLLLVHTMQPEMTINWCMKRAEIVFKCVKGFMLENTMWTDSASRNIQFLVPTGLSNEMFEEFCNMLPNIFRVTSTRNLTSRRRTYSYSYK